MLAALARRAGAVRVTGIPQGKFLAPLAPGEPCVVGFPTLTPDEARFECASGGRVIARGTLRLQRR